MAALPLAALHHQMERARGALPSTTSITAQESTFSSSVRAARRDGYDLTTPTAWPEGV